MITYSVQDKPTPEEEQLDVSEMLKDFSDKLNENLLPDPWDADSDWSDVMK